MRLLPHIETKWPYLLSEGYEVTSIATWSYNCIAFAADVENLNWWPDLNGKGFWPIKWREVSLPCFIAAFQSIGYNLCENALEAEYDRIAIYALNGTPTHAAKQLHDGRWKSKLGRSEDIEHKSLKAVEEFIYGKAVVFMRRSKLAKQ